EEDAALGVADDAGAAGFEATGGLDEDADAGVLTHLDTVGVDGAEDFEAVGAASTDDDAVEVDGGAGLDAQGCTTIPLEARRGLALGTEAGDLHVRDDGILNVGRSGMQNDRALTHGLHLAERFGEGAERSLLGPVADTTPRVAVDVPDGVAWETRPRHVVTSRGIPTGLARRT